MRLYICNALAMGMLDREVQARDIANRATQGMPRIPTPITLEQARDLLHPTLDGQALPIEIIAAVGHVDTARLIADALGLAVEQVHGRITVRLGEPSGPWESVECALIGAYVGPRLPEGCTTLPEGASLEWWRI